MAASEPAFTGRSRECEALDRMLVGARRGESAVLVIRGEAGIGKTALLQYCAREARDHRVVQVAGVEAELEMPFAALHQLCGQMMGQLAALPDPQRDALQVAFGLAVGNVPDQFLVGLAVLSLLAEAAAERPLVCLVDDAHWLDGASMQVLGFVARRLLAEAVVLVFAVREVGNERLFPAIPTLTIEGLAMDDARALLKTVVPGHLDAQVRDRIVAETRGNPLALLELPREMARAELSGGFAVPASAWLSGDLSEHYLRRIQALPERTQRLLLLAAADPTGDATLLWRAAQARGIGREAAAVAHAERLVEIGAQVRFRHPLVRSAAYLAGTPDERRAAHVALAAVMDERTDRDRRAWHMAAAATGPDDDIAVELERMAGAAQARGGLAAAAAFLERAAALTSDLRLRAERTLGAAEANMYAGVFDAALGLLVDAEADAVDDLQRARVERLRGQIQWASVPGREAPVLLLQAAARLERLDIGLARETYLEAWLASFTAGRFAQAGGHLREVSRAARRAPHPATVKYCDLFLDGYSALVNDGHAAATQPLRDAVNMFLGGEPAADWLQWGWVATGTACMIWDADCLGLLSAQHIDVCRASGALAQLVFALDSFAMVAVWRGDFEAATALIAEAAALKDVTGTRMFAPGKLMLVAYQGRREEASPLISAVVSDAIARGEGLGFDVAQWATSILHNGLGGYADAVAAAERVVDEKLETNMAGWALAELVEGASRSGNAQLAGEALRRLLASVTHLHGSDWALGIAARSRALLADESDAERWYVEAVERLGRTPWRIELARAHLVYGEWLRRMNRGTDARDQLRAGYDLFTGIGAEAFAERTRRELVATGETMRKRQVDTQIELTAQEEHIARLARDGRSNAEISASAYLSVRTVEWHLHKVFTKLHITSRRQLKDVLPTSSR